MSIFRKSQKTFVPINADIAKSHDWVVLLEAATIVGQSREKLRVALTTRDRQIRKRRRVFGRTEYFLVLEQYDPRIHALYFCPQLYKNEDGALVPLTGEEIGQLMAKALEGGAIEKAPWYEPTERTPENPVIKSVPATEFDSLVVDAPVVKPTKATRPVLVGDKET